MASIDSFLAACRAALTEQDPPRVVEALLQAWLADAGWLRDAMGLGAHESSDSAQYLFLHQSTDLTVLHATLPPLLRSPPHNHLAWAVVGMYEGRESHVFYRREGNVLTETGSRELVAPGVLSLGAEVIHSIANPDRAPSKALHVYGGTLTNPARSIWNPASMAEEPFQLSAITRYERELTLAAGGASDE